MVVWRLCSRRFAASAFSGEGGRRFAARWNSVGTPLVYASPALSLAALEVFVHLPSAAVPEDLVRISAELPGDLADVPKIDRSSLPQDWRDENHLRLREIGDEWIAARTSLVLLVPSVIIDIEWNCLINPQHPQARDIHVESPHPFYFDSRMFKQRGQSI